MEGEARDLAAFIAFVDDCIWSRLPVECRDVASGPQPTTEPTKRCMRPDGCDDEWRCTSQEVGACGAKTIRPQPVAQQNKEA